MYGEAYETALMKLWSERENQKDATIRCLLSTVSQHVSGIIIPIFRRTKTVCYCTRFAALVLLDVVGSGCGALRCRVLAPYNAAPHNRYQPHPAVPAQHTTCSNTRLGLLKMGIMMPETCSESVDNEHLTVASCWFSLSLHNLLTMHGHRNLKRWWNCIWRGKGNAKESVHEFPLKYEY